MKQILMNLKENRLLPRLMPIAFLIMIGMAFALATSGRFTDSRNLRLIIEQTLITGIVATGAIFIFASGNVNIAMGAATSLIATVSALIYQNTGSLAVMIASAIVLGVALMVLSALISTALKVRVIFVTIVMMILLMSIQRTIIGGATIMMPFELTSMLRNANFSYLLFIGYFIFCVILFEFTAVGRRLKFLGTNQVCAEHSGINQGIVLVIAFLVAGIGVGLGALMLIVRTGAISITTAATLNMDVMLAIVLGGMSVFGGTRSFIYSAVIGALTVTVLNNGLLMIGVSATILQGIRGILFLLLVFSSQKRPKGLPAPEY